MLVLGIETSCDETGVALYDTGRGLLAHAVHSQIAMHAEYGGVVPELASRDHVRRLLPLVRDVHARAGVQLVALDAVAYTEGPGLAGALLVGASVAEALALALGIPAIGIHHLEGHLVSPLLSRDAPQFPFVALLVSGGHTQLMTVQGVGRYVRCWFAFRLPVPGPQSRFRWEVEGHRCCSCGTSEDPSAGDPIRARFPRECHASGSTPSTSLLRHRHRHRQRRPGPLPALREQSHQFGPQRRISIRL
jgi:hypothetical protein